MEIKVGQIWREVDSRMERFIRIESTNGIYPTIRSVYKHDDGWRPRSRSRSSQASPDRFNGKRGGYKFVEVDWRYALHFG